MTTDDDFKELTGPDALDVSAGDADGIVEIDEEEVPAVVEDDALETDGFGLNGRPKEDGEEAEDPDDDYSAMEALLMEANGWEER